MEEENLGVENEAEAEVEEKLARLRQCQRKLEEQAAGKAKPELAQASHWDCD